MNQKLNEYGYQENNIEEYRRWKYSTRKSTIYRVKSGFPRIIENDLPSGVGNVNYDISVEQCESFQVSEKRFKNYSNKSALEFDQRS